MFFYAEAHQFISIPEGALVDCEFPQGTFLWLKQKDRSNVYTFVEDMKLFDTLEDAIKSLLPKDNNFHKSIDQKAAIIKIDVEEKTIIDICSIYLASNLNQEIPISNLVLKDALDKINKISPLPSHDLKLQ